MEIIRRIQAGAFAHPEFNDTPDYVDYFTADKEVMPLSAGPVHKSSFVPSKWELQKVKDILRGMKDGTYVSIAERRRQQQQSGDAPFLIWQDTEDEVLAESKRY